MVNRSNDKVTNPPTWARKLLEQFCPERLLEELEGDLLEEYNFQLKRMGKRRADWNYVINVLSFIHPSHIIRKQISTPTLFRTMWKNYLTTAVRNFTRNKTYSLINLAGLIFGISCTMLIFQYVLFENSADNFHVKGNQIYRVAYKRVINGGTPEVLSQIHLGAGEAFQNEILGIEQVTRIRADFFQEGPTITYESKNEKMAFKDVRAILADSGFFQMFSFPLLKGNPNTALNAPNAGVISESLAKKLFGNTEALGKTIEYSMNQGIHSLIITGVVKDVPANSHIQFDIILPLEHYISNIPQQAKEFFSPWKVKEFTTYVLLQNGVDQAYVRKMMDAIIQKNLIEQQENKAMSVTTILQPMNSLYYDRATDLGTVGFGSAIVSTRTGDQRMMYFFTVIAFITIGISLLSYVNLSTIRSLDRAKEVGVRKLIGAYQYHLRMQFMAESMLMNAGALTIALTVTILMIPLFNDFVGSRFTISAWFSDKFLVLIASLFGAGAVLSWIYPAFVMSSLKPIIALKGMAGSTTSRSQLRKVFVVLQYTPAIALLVCTMVVYDQLEYMRNRDIGFDMKGLITIRSPRFLPDGVRSFEAEAMFKNQVKTLSSVQSASFSGNQAGRGLNFLIPFEVDSVNDGGVIFFKGSGVDHDFADVYGLTLRAGNVFAPDMNALYGDEKEFIRKVLVNETAIRYWGFKKNTDAVGRLVTSADGSRYYIQGVLEDFNWASLHRSTDPVMLWYTPNNRFMTIRIEAGSNQANVLADIKAIYDQLFPNDVFHYEFAEDVYRQQYMEDEKYANLFIVFSTIATMIASLGLFGLSAFTAERRSREISIRKVLGANARQIVQLLSRDFLILVLIAAIVASPIAWLVMQRWLQTFAFHVNLNAVPFIITIVGSLMIAFITVSLKSMRAANTNPVNSLRAE